MQDDRVTFGKIINSLARFYAGAAPSSPVSKEYISGVDTL